MRAQVKRGEGEREREEKRQEEKCSLRLIAFPRCPVKDRR